MGENLDEKYVEQCRTELTKINPGYLNILLCFQTKSEPFPKSYFEESLRENTNAVTYWKSLKKTNKISDQFCDFIIILMNCSASSAGIERMFSNMALIHSKLRNRLGNVLRRQN